MVALPEQCVGADVPERVLDEILGRWTAALRGVATEPARQDERGRAERNLLRTLLRAAGADPHDASALTALTLAATRYGRLQPIHRVDPGEVTRQFSVLRREVERALRQREVCAQETLSALHRVDAALSVAMLAVVRGGHAL